LIVAKLGIVGIDRIAPIVRPLSAGIRAEPLIGHLAINATIAATADELAAFPL
jgi:hypothetical protein